MNKEVIIEQQVVNRRVVEVPVRIVKERPYDVVKEEVLTVPKYVNRTVERLIVQPHETRVV